MSEKNEIPLSQVEPEMPLHDSTQKTGSRRKMFPLSLKMLGYLFTEGDENHYRVLTGLPKNAVIIDLCPDFLRSGQATILVESDSFDEVKEGDQYPMGGVITFKNI